MPNNEPETPNCPTYTSTTSHSEQDQALSAPISTPQPASQEVTDCDILKHSVFRLEQENLFSPLLNIIRSIVSTTANQNKNISASTAGWEWLEQLIEEIFGKKSIRQLQGEFKKLEIKYNHACGKLLANGEVYFRCLDCDQSHHTGFNDSTVICSECFEKANHKGHRVLMLKNEAGSSLACSCGISEFLSQRGFCSKHGASPDKVADILAKLPLGFAENFVVTLKKAFYSVIAVLEFSGRAQTERSQEALLAIGQLAMEELLLFCTISYAEIHESIIVLLGMLFRSTMLDGYNMLWHDCNNTESSTVNEPHRCTCTVLGLLFRHSNKFNEELQMKLHKLLVDCAKDNEFKPFLCEEFTKYSQCIFLASNQNYHGEYSRSSLINIERQLFNSETLREVVLKAGYFNNLIEVMRTTAKNVHQNKQALYDIIESISTILVSFLKNKSSISAQNLVTETALTKDLLDIVYQLQAKNNNRVSIRIGTHEHQVDYSSVDWAFRLENIATSALERSFHLIMDSNEQERATLQQQLLENWKTCFDMLDSNTDNHSVPFNTALEKTLVLMLFNSSQDLGAKEISSFMKHISETSEQVLDGIVKRLGTIRYMHLSHDYNTASGLESYYGIKSLSFEKDITGIQMLASTLETRNIFEILAKQFFSYSNELQTFLLEDVKEITQDDYFRTKLLVLEDFLNLLVFIMNDETCLFNMTRAREEMQPFSRINSTAKYERLIEKVLVNALLGQYSVDITSIKNMIANILGETNQIEHILKKIAIYDPKTRKIRIKEEYKDELDPYLFYKMPALQKEIVHVVSQKPAEKDRKIDLVSGKFKTDCADYLKSIQKGMYESTLPEFLASFVQNFNEALAPMTRPVLKLILTHLQFAREFSQESAAVKKIATNYINKLFITNLSNMSKLKDLSDCEACINKIQELLRSFASDFGQEGLFVSEESEKATSQAEASSSKKDQMAKRMQQLKAEFMKKQKLFMNKNTHLLDESPTEEKSCLLEANIQQAQQEDLVCQHCLEQLNNDSDTFGIPIYVSFTNNLYDTQQEVKFKRDDHPERLKGEWWPVVSSCMHYYHQKCYQTLFINSRTSNNQPSNYYSNDMETCCSLCKTLCNNFLPVNKGNCEETDTGSSHDEQQRKSYPKLFMSFSNKMDELIKDLRRRLGGNSSEVNADCVTSQEIAERAYYYFLESFSQVQNSQQQKKLYNLYEKFFKVYMPSIANDSCDDHSSFLERLAVQTGSQTPEGLLNQSLFDNLAKYHKMETSIESYRNAQLDLMNEYLAFKAISLLNGSDELQESVIRQISFPLQKILLATSLNQDILYDSYTLKKDDDFSLIQQVEIGTDEINQLLQKVFNQDLTIQEMIKQAVKTANLPLLQTIITGNLGQSKITRLAPKVIQLPQTYAEFNSLYFKKKCSRCNQFSKNLSTCLCLHCGKVICLACCHTSESDRDFGNLNKHARRYHLGSAVFLEIQRLTKTIICSPVNAVYPGEDVYTDELGQPIQYMIKHDKPSVYALDFNMFTLNPDFVEYVRNLVSTHGMAKEAFTVSKICGYYTHDNVL